MPDFAVLIALLALVALVEFSPLVRLPIGLLLAIAMLSGGFTVLRVALVGAGGVAVARLALALMARRGRDRYSSASPAARAQRDAMRRRLATSPAYSRITFTLAALPVVPATFIFPLLGAMRAPLIPALTGTIVGRIPLLALTTALFAWMGRLVSADDAEGAVVLGVLACMLLLLSTVGRIDWQHRSETGRFRLRPTDDRVTRMTAMFAPERDDDRSIHAEDDGEFVEGILLGEELDDEHSDDDDDIPPPPAISPTGLAPG